MNDVKRPTLSVIMPVYNEAPTIREALARVAQSPVDKEILVVDDGSTDGTRDLLRAMEKEGCSHPLSTWRMIYQEKNQGKGSAIRRAIPEARGQITIIQDADLECNPDEYGAIIAPILDGRADVVYGSRFHCGVRRISNLWHRAGNRFLTTVSNICTGLTLNDMETCYKAFKSELLQSIPIRANRFDFEPEITAKVARRQFRIYEVPVSYDSRTYAQGKKIGTRDAVMAIATILKYWLINDAGPK